MVGFAGSSFIAGGVVAATCSAVVPLGDAGGCAAAGEDAVVWLGLARCSAGRVTFRGFSVCSVGCGSGFDVCGVTVLIAALSCDWGPGGGGGAVALVLPLGSNGGTDWVLWRSRGRPGRPDDWSLDGVATLGRSRSSSEAKFSSSWMRFL